MSVFKANASGDGAQVKFRICAKILDGRDADVMLPGDDVDSIFNHVETESGDIESFYKRVAKQIAERTPPRGDFTNGAVRATLKMLFNQGRDNIKAGRIFVKRTGAFIDAERTQQAAAGEGNASLQHGAEDGVPLLPLPPPAAPPTPPPPSDAEEEHQNIDANQVTTFPQVHSEADQIRAIFSSMGPDDMMLVYAMPTIEQEHIVTVEDLISLSDSDLNDMANRFGMPLGHRQRFINYIKMLGQTNGA